MNIELFSILSACETLHNAEYEINNKFFLFRRKYKKELNTNKSRIREKIQNIINDKWDTKYLFDTQKTIINFYDKLKPFIENRFYIPDVEKINAEDNKFHSMYFFDTDVTKNKNNIIIIDIISDNINFTIFDSNTGNSFIVTSSHEVQESQKKIESVCKHIFVDSIMDFLNKNSH